MSAPILMSLIPDQVVNERAAYAPFDLKKYIQVPEGSEKARFSAETIEGDALPQGMICTEDGFLTGIPAENTSGTYEVVVTAENNDGALQERFTMTIKPALFTSNTEYQNQFKNQVWEALGKNLPVPDIVEIYGREISFMEVYYLLERWGVLTMYDAFNLDAPGEKKLLTLPGVSKHYNVYDRGCCLVATPKDLFSHERTVLDGIMTAKAMAREVYERKWTIELTGFEKFTRAAWFEIQHLGDFYGKHLEVTNFQPTLDDLRRYRVQSERLGMGGGNSGGD